MKKYIFIFCFLKLVIVNAYASDSWVIKSFPDSVRIKNIAINSINEIFITSAYSPDDEPWLTGLVYFSNDDGNSWVQLNSDNTFPEIFDILIDSNDNIYLATYWGGGIYKSIDNGITWEEKNNGISNYIPAYLSINSEGALYAGQFAMGDLDYTIDGGEEWIQMGYSSGGIKGLGINFTDNIFVDGEKYSRDNGNTWITIDEGLSNSVLLNSVRYSFNHNNEVFLGTVEGVYFLDPIDSIWTKVLNISDRISDLIISSENKIYAGTKDSVYYSGNNGEDWQNINEQFSSSPPDSFCFDSDGYLWAAADSTLYKSQNIISNIQNKLINSKKIKIYPNPFNDYVQIDFKDVEYENLKISIYGLDGKLIVYINENITYDNSIKIDLSDLEPGIYIVKFDDKNLNIQNKKLIKYQ